MLPTPPSNPRLSKLLLWSARHRHRWPVFHRLICAWLGSDIFASLPTSTQLPHPYGIVIHSDAVLGEGCTVMQQVTIGAKSNRATDRGVPEVGDGVYIGAGAKVLGPVRIGAGAIIGANAVVTIDIPDCRTVVGGNRLLPESRG